MNILLLITSYLTESGDSAFTSPSGYHPHLLDDPELTSGRHRKVLNLASYLVCMQIHHEIIPFAAVDTQTFN